MKSVQIYIIDIMKSFLDSFLTPLRNTFTKAKEVAQPLFVDAVNRVGESIQNINIPDISNPNNPISNTAKPYIENLVNPQRTTKTLSTLEGQKNLVEQVGMGMGPEMMVQTKVALPIFKGTKNLTTKVLNQLKGKDLVSRQFIEDILKQPGLKQKEKEIIQNVLDTYKTPELFTKKPWVHSTSPKAAKSIEKEGFNIKKYLGTGDTTTESEPVGAYFHLSERGMKNYAKVNELEDYLKRATIKVEPPERLFKLKSESQWSEVLKKSYSSPGKTKGERVTNYLKERGYEGIEDAKGIISGYDEPQGIIFDPKMPQNKIPIKDFAKKVESELLPLERNNSTFSQKYEHIVLPDELRGNVALYRENIYESPIKTSAGQVHFGNKSKNYFGHTRVEDMNNGGTRRVIEVQSDLYQKGNLEKEVFNTGNRSELMKLMSSSDKKIYQEAMDNAPIYRDGKDWYKVMNNLEKKYQSKIEINRRNELSKLQQYNDPTAHFRMVREEVKQAAIDGKTKLQFPTGETAMKIEGLGDTTSFQFLPEGNTLLRGGVEDLSPQNMKVGMEISQGGVGGDWIITEVLGDGKFKASQESYYEAFKNKDISKEVFESRIEQFDISGKVDINNPIYKFYEKDLGKYLQNKYKAKLITDPQGVSWYELDVPKEAGKVPVEAFSVIPFIKPKEDKKELFISK